MMTIDERVDELIEAGKELRKLLRRHLLEVARDQRHACAGAIATLPPAARQHVDGCVFKDMAHQAVMNANLK